MREIQIRKLFGKAVKTMHAAKLLLSNSFNEDAISAAYYSIFYAAKAALLSQDVIVTKSHRALRGAFGQHLINSGLIEKDYGKILSNEYDQRIFSDYDESYEASQEDAEWIISDAERFISRMKDFIQSKEISLPTDPVD